MSMYNLLHGVNPLAPVLLKILGITEEDCGRFRDIHLNEDGTKIILYTRNGGGNREDHQHIFDKLRKHPGYLKDYDDNFDNTYAYIEFTVPVQYLAYAKILAKKLGKPETVHEKFQRVMQEIEDMPQEKLENDPRFKPITDILKKIGEDLK